MAGDMPVFQVRSPEGAVYELQAPDEATASRLFEELKAAGQLPPRVGSQGQTAEQAPPGQMPNDRQAAGGAPPIPPAMGFWDRAKDVAQSGAAGVVRGAGELATLPITVGHGADWIGDKLGVPQLGDRDSRGPLGQAQDAMRGFFDQTLHQPQTTAGEFARTIGEFAPGALVAPGTIPSRLGRFGVVPGTISEGAGQLTDETALEPYARLGGAIVGGAAGGAGARSSPPAAILRGRIKEASVQDISRAEAMIAQAQQQGVNLTWPEALHQVTNGRVDITDVQRVLEQSSRGRGVMSGYLADRPGQVEQAAGRAIQDVGAGARTGGSPYAAGLDLQGMANTALTDIRKRINAATEPLYRAAGPTQIDPAAFAQLQSDEMFQTGLKAVRRLPEHSRFIQGMPDDSVGVLNEIKKYFDDISGNRASTGRNQAASVYGQAADDARQAGRQASPEYGQALDTQTQMRRQELNPAEIGPLGQIAGTDNIVRQGEAVLPRRGTDQIRPGMEGDVHSTMRTLAASDPDAATNLLITQLQSLADEALAQSPTGLNQYGGAIFNNLLRGSSQQARNLRAAVLALPDGAVKLPAFLSMLDTLEATGRRARPGSSTTFNTELQTAMDRGGAMGTLGTIAASPPRALTYINDAYKELRLGRNTEQLARILIDPEAAPLLQQLTAARSASDKTRIIATLLYEGEQTRQGNIGAGSRQPLSFAPLQ
jgi:hypothetical protein